METAQLLMRLLHTIQQKHLQIHSNNVAFIFQNYYRVNAARIYSHRAEGPQFLSVIPLFFFPFPVPCACCDH